MCTLNLDELNTSTIPGITPVLGKMHAEAAAFCLESQEHMKNVKFQVRGYLNRYYSLTWTATPQNADAAWNDSEFTTEQGAVGLALLLINKEFSETVITRARKGDGFDYWLGNVSIGDSQITGRLEVSGIRSGDESVVKARVQQKLKQVSRSDRMEIPAIVIVVEFSCPLGEIQKKDVHVL